MASGPNQSLLEGRAGGFIHRTLTPCGVSGVVLMTRLSFDLQYNRLEEEKGKALRGRVILIQSWCGSFVEVDCQC